MTDYDHTEVYRRHIDGARLIFESPEDPGSARYTRDASDPGVIRWRNEMPTGDRSWFLIGSSRRYRRNLS